jgi:hypothetical protein
MNGDSMQPFYLATAQDSKKAKSPTGIEEKGWTNANSFNSR